MPGLQGSLYTTWMQHGLKLEGSRKYGQAIHAFETALRYDPTSADASYHLGRCLALGGKTTEAIQTLTALLARAPDRGDAVLLLERLLRQKGKPAQAAGVIDAYVRRHPGDPTMLAELGSAWLSAGKPDYAASALERALAAGSKAPGLHRKLGLAYLALKKPAQAEPQLRLALNEKPSDLQAGLALADLLASGQRWLEVVIVTRSLTRLLPKDPRPWWPMADAYAAMADVTSCANCLGWAVKLTPAKDQQKAAMQAISLASGRNLPEVIARLADMKVLPTDPDVLAGEAQAMAMVLRWSDAAKLYEQAGAKRPNLMIRAAQCWTQAGDKAKALACLSKASPTDPAALMGAVKLAVAMKRPELAQGYLRKLLALRPYDANLHLALSEVLAESGKLRQALLQAEEARGKAPADALGLLGSYYERTGQLEAAAQAYSEAWRLGHKLQDAEDAARMLRQTGQWDRMSRLLAEAPKHTPELRVAAARLVLHGTRPDRVERAMKTLEGLDTPASEEVRAEALAAAGDLVGAVGAAAKAWDGCQDRVGLCSVLRQAAGNPRARNKALNLVPRMLADPTPAKGQLAAVDALLTTGFGPQGRLRALSRLAMATGAPVQVVRYAAEQLTASGEATTARIVADRAARSASDRSAKAQLLALAAKACLASNALPRAADYLLRAASLLNKPVLVGRFAVMKQTDKATPSMLKAMNDVADAWSTGGPDTGAILALLQSSGDPAVLAAWVNADSGTPGERALRQGKYALMQGKPDLALTYLSKAPAGPVTLRARIAALLKAGRASEADVPAEALLRHGPTPQDLDLVGDVALAMHETNNALWWYTRAVVEGAGGPAVVKLEQTAEKLDLDRKTLDAVAAAARQSMPAD